MGEFDIESHLQTTRPPFLDELNEYLEIPSISADHDHRDDVRRSVEYVQTKLESLGFDTERTDIPGATILGGDAPGHPVLYAERIIDSNFPTLAFYMHSDVQPIPADQLPGWKVDGRQLNPLRPNYMSGKFIGIDTHNLHLVCRGATDDKGQGWSIVGGIEAALADPDLRNNFNVRVLVEAEEEAHGNSVELALQQGGRILDGLKASDVVIASDTGTLRHGHPALTTTLRGISTAHIETENVYDLVHIINQARHPRTGRVLLEGFYNGVEDVQINPLLSDALREDHAATFPIERAASERPYTPQESCTVRPTFSPLRIDYANPNPQPHDSIGLVTVKVTATGAHRDAHSGEFGGAVPEPGRDLCNILGGMLEQGVKLQIDYLRNGSRTPSTSIQCTAEAQITYSEAEHEQVVDAIDRLCAQYEFDRSAFSLQGVEDRAAYLNGEWFDHSGHKPFAYVSARLVPNQTAEENFIGPLTALAENVSSGTATVTSKGGGGTYVADKDHPMCSLVSRTMATTQGLPDGQLPDEINLGGSIPVIALLQQKLQGNPESGEKNVPVYLVGCGTPDGRLHSALENIGVTTGLEMGRRTTYHIIRNVVLDAGL